MLEEFFNTIAVPDFIKPEFEKTDWYLLIARSKEILNKLIEKTELLSQGKNLSINGKVYIGTNCVIGENVVIDGPVYIADNVEIGPGAYIRAGSIISKGCSVGHAAEVKNSLMMEGSKVANHVFLGDSIIGSTARIGGHCETANRRFDQLPVEFIYKGVKLSTGLDKLGVVLGEGSRLGGGVFTAPGTMIGKNSFVETMASVQGYVPENMFVKNEISVRMIPNKFSGELKHTKLFERT
jgi:NDP-sugar pyrophosphorylase family protein